jgi:MFS family permease
MGVNDNQTARAGVLVPLFVIQFLSWSGMFCLWIYAVPVITQFIFQARGESGAYRSGLIAVSACFALYALLAALLAFALPALLRRFGAGTIYGVALLTGSAGLMTLGVAETPLALVPAFVAIGVGWSAMSNIPYALAGAFAPQGRGSHTLRLFSFSTVLPQVSTTLFLAIAAAPLFGDALNRVILAGGGMMALGGVVALALRQRFDLPAESW